MKPSYFLHAISVFTVMGSLLYGAFTLIGMATILSSIAGFIIACISIYVLNMMNDNYEKRFKEWEREEKEYNRRNKYEDESIN